MQVLPGSWTGASKSGAAVDCSSETAGNHTPTLLPELLTSINVSTKPSLEAWRPADQAAVLSEIMQQGLFSVTVKGARVISRLMENGDLSFGHTNGEVLDAGILERLEGKGCKNPGMGYLAICTKIRNQAWAVNEWLAYHKLMGVEHVHFVVDKNEDNFIEVVKRWRPFASTSDHEPNTQYLHKCFLEFSPKYKWIAFIELDEYLTPLREDCMHEVLKDYEKFGGLAVSNGLYNDSNQVGAVVVLVVLLPLRAPCVVLSTPKCPTDCEQHFTRPHHMTSMEATNFTLGVRELQKAGSPA